MDERTQQTPDDFDLYEGDSAQRWTLVIAYHPDTERIGECWSGPATDTLTINRGYPLFSRAGSAGRALLDTRVGRDLLYLNSLGDRWQLQRIAGRCRVRVDGSELQRTLALDAEQLQAGLVILLANTVLLHLRLEGAAQVDAISTSAELLGVSTQAHRLRAQIAQAAMRQTDVLLLGPSGAGKELVARAIHRQATARAAPWVAVNMSVLTPELAAAELFGARRGAFTGADRDRPGFFRQAHGGTLFLDEIGDTPPTVQPLLLRALQQREIQVVGGAIERVELRVIAATEIDPDRPENGFRAALRYRLGSCEIRLPALRERREDIGTIAADTLRKSLAERGLRWQTDVLEPREVARWARCFESLLLRDWPGNIRELLHRVGEIAALSDRELREPDGLWLRESAASPWIAGTGDAEDRAADAEPASGRRSAVDLTTISDEEFSAVWYACRGEVTAVAQHFGVSRAAIYRRRRGLPGCRLARDVPRSELLAALNAQKGDINATASALGVSVSGLRVHLSDEDLVRATLGDRLLNPGLE